MRRIQLFRRYLRRQVSISRHRLKRLRRKQEMGPCLRRGLRGESANLYPRKTIVTPDGHRPSGGPSRVGAVGVGGECAPRIPHPRTTHLPHRSVMGPQTLRVGGDARGEHDLHPPTPCPRRRPGSLAAPCAEPAAGGSGRPALALGPAPGNRSAIAFPPQRRGERSGGALTPSLPHTPPCGAASRGGLRVRPSGRGRLRGHR